MSVFASQSCGLHVTRGATWNTRIEFLDCAGDPLDLSGYSLRMQVRTAAGRWGMTADETLAMELTTDNGRLVLTDPAAGVISIAVPAAETVQLNPDNIRRCQLYYSIEAYFPRGGEEVVMPLMDGSITVRGETTR
ncbi:MAG: hypothetical protein LBL59_08800 [Xanthomonadaceae bacterium]|jgi:hypothetical protein|nr:hypothetical protein [Xanthomonadaceae bacterium]